MTLRSRVANHDDVLREGSRARRRLLQAREHGAFDVDEVLLADPSLACRSWIERSEEAFDEAEVESVKGAVLRARRMQRLEADGNHKRVRQVAAALLVAVGLALVAWRVAPYLASEPIGSGNPQAGIAMTHPSLEALDLPAARVYELAAEEFSVVLVVDESFEL